VLTDEQPAARTAFETGLATDYFALSGLQSSSIAEAGVRATMLFTTLTGTGCSRSGCKYAMVKRASCVNRGVVGGRKPERLEEASQVIIVALDA
jgi:hypothetical protein